MQHTRRLTGVQHMKYYSCASYNCAAHEDGSRVVHEIELACSTRKLTLMSHASSDRVNQQKYKNTRVLLHMSVNLDMSGTIFGCHFSMSIPSIKYYLMICSYLHIIYVTILPGQQIFGHDLLTSLEPEHFFPPQEGVGLVQVLVQLCVPSPHVLLHGPQLQELHPPSTTQ